MAQVHNAPQILGTWSRGRQALAIGIHNLVQNNGKSNLFKKIYPNIMSKRIGNKIFMIFSSCMCWLVGCVGILRPFDKV